MPNTREKLIDLMTAFYGVDPGYYGVEAYPLADHLIANGVTVQEWISVKDRLPEESGEYLAYCGEYDGICVLYFEISKTKGRWMRKWKEVTHWMPLPEPPRGG